jgi:geranylgeranyl pyrophosphate synthase
MSTKRGAVKILYTAIERFLAHGGKKLRPHLCALCAQVAGGTQEHVYHAGLAIEYFHNFTLIHDDIEDNSLLRRGQPCLHITYGVPSAINMGDTLFCLATQKILDAPYCEQEKVFLLQLLNKNFLKVFEGQAMELGWHHNKTWDLQEQDYLDMIERKTGALIAVSCKIGAYLGGATLEQQDLLYRFGMALGISFQIQDDVLNLIGQEEKYKKEIGGDITEGKRTLMVLHALNNPLITQQDKQELRNILDSNTTDKEKIQWCVSLLTQSGHIISQAIALLEKHFSPGEAREQLIKIAHDLITRES